MACRVKQVRVGPNLILERVVTDTGSRIDNLLDESLNLRPMLRQAEDVVDLLGGVLIRGQVLVVELGDLVHVGELTQGTEEVIS